MANITDAERITMLRAFAQSMTEANVYNRTDRAREVLAATAPMPRYYFDNEGDIRDRNVDGDCILAFSSRSATLTHTQRAAILKTLNHGDAYNG